VEPYNTALATHHVLDAVNCSLLFDNKSIYDICGSKLDLLKPTYANINSIVALVCIIIMQIKIHYKILQY